MFKKIRGTKDIINFDLYNNIFDKIRSHLNLYSFKEIKTPTIESVDLFSHTLGGESDVISKEIYLVTTKHKDIDSNDEKICLRPELTAPIMRAFLEENFTKRPWRVFSIGSAFRHERPQKGRYREFSTCSIEMIDAESTFYDSELIIILNNFFKNLGLKNYKLKINYIGTAIEREIYKKKLVEFLKLKISEIPEKMHEKITEEKVFGILDKMNDELSLLLKDMPKITDFISDLSKQKWNEIKQRLTDFEINYEIDSSLVRGLEYYNGFVFEFKTDLLGAQNTFCGGGRYDGLAKVLGAKENLPSVGAGIGIDRLILFLEAENLINEKKDRSFAIIISNKEYELYAQKIAENMIKNKLKVEIYADTLSIKNGLKKASKDNINEVLIIGEEEFSSNTITIKDLSTRDQKKVLIEEVYDYLILKKVL